MLRTLALSLIAGTLTYFGGGAATSAHAQTTQQRPPVVARTPNGPIVTALTIDLRPIPSRITHGVVAVQNNGTAPSLPSVITVNCHLPGQTGGCPEIPANAMAAYTNPAYPNRLVVQVPAIQPGHVYNHNLSFWPGYNIPAGTYVFDFVADAGATNNETNEANNTGTYSWVKP